MNHSTDIELIQRIKQDDSDAFKIIFDRYWEGLYASALKRLKTQDESEDIVQEIFADIWNRRYDLKIASNLSSYLYTAVKYHVFKVIESRKRDRDVIASENHSVRVCDDVLAFDELYELLEIALEKLPLNQKSIFKMSRFEGLKSNEIADKLHISQQTVHNSLSKTLSILRVEFKDYTPVVLFLSFVESGTL